MLEANGYDDAKRGIDRETGWKEIAEALDYPVHTRTPAQERYLDGWYRGKS